MLCYSQAFALLKLDVCTFSLVIGCRIHSQRLHYDVNGNKRYKWLKKKKDNINNNYSSSSN